MMSGGRADVAVGAGRQVRHLPMGPMFSGPTSPEGKCCKALMENCIASLRAPKEPFSCALAYTPRDFLYSLSGMPPFRRPAFSSMERNFGLRSRR